MSEQHRRLIIIGSGPAGLTAAIYAARAELQPLLIGGAEWGGQLMLTTDVGNYPGFTEDIQGPALMERMRDQALRFGTTLIPEDVIKVSFGSTPFQLTTSGGVMYTADCVIVATGASARWLNLPSEQRLRGKGVSACATCDGFFFKGKDVVVVGGGDTAMEDATFLTKFANHVTIMLRGPASRASKIMVERAMNNPKITMLYNTVVDEVLGDERVTGLNVTNVETKASSTLDIQGLFIAIGHTPNTTVFADQLELGKQGYLVVHDITKTNVPGVFACGDVQDYRYRQAITAAGSGCMAALDAERYLHDHATSPTSA